MITLRHHQSQDIHRIRDAFANGAQAPLYVLPTGGGKTVTFSSIAHSSEQRGKRVLILAHRIELVDQIVRTLNQFDVRPDILAAGYTRMTGPKRANVPVTVASVDTLIRRLADYPSPTLIICDEAHHVAPNNKWSTIFRAFPQAKRLGVTATPIRLDGHGLGHHFDRMILGPTYQELIEMGHLVRLRVFAPPLVDISKLHSRAGDYKKEETEALLDRPSITGDALSHYREHANGKPALAFCTSVAHAYHVAEQFRAGGVVALALDGGTDSEVRRRAVADFRAGHIRVLASCDLFSEGFDVPGVHCGILLRPTQSMSLYLQQCGRIARPELGKPYGVILDHVGNAKFGLPDETRPWELTSDIVQRKKLTARPAHICPKCWAASPFRSTRCVECGYAFETKGRIVIKTRQGKLLELTPEEAQARREKMGERQMQGRARSLQELIEFGKRKGYAEGWAECIWSNRKRKVLLPGQA